MDAFTQSEQLVQNGQTDATSASSDAKAAPDQKGLYAFPKRQIEIGEADEASVFLETRIEDIEITEHLTHPSLVEPLTLLGDARITQGQIKEGLLLYDRAIFIQRVNFGLFDSKQLNIIYKEADGLKLLGDLEEAQKREEYAYEILQRAYSQDDLRRIPGLVRLAEFYDTIYGYLASRVFYRKSLQILIANGREWELEAIPLHNGIAHSYLMERFPPFYVSDGFDSRSIGIVPALNDADRFQQNLSINNFPEGERALQAAVTIATQQEPQNKELIEEAIMRLGDWHLMWDRQKEANALYISVYQSMEARNIDPNLTFEIPKLIYLPEPKEPRRPESMQSVEPAQGLVELKFLVKTNGRIAKMETIKTEPPKLMEFQIRRSLREAVFRPAFFEGIPVKNYPHTFVYEYDYFPSENLPGSSP
ncbi:MAG: hypothetical protein ACJ0Q3_03145 [Candidatus Azotimanducaceae bacterium]